MLYEIVVFIHVLAAVGLLSGSVIGSPIVRAAVRRAEVTEEIRAHLRIGRPLLVLEPASAVAVLLSGIYLTSVANFWALGWVQVAAALWLVNSIVAGALVKPVVGSITSQAAASAGAVDARLDTIRWSPRWSVGGDMLMANDAAVLFIMILKTGLAGSLLAVAGANLLVATVRVLGPGFRHAPSGAGPASAT